MKYELLNKPFKIGNVELRNRFVMLPMTIEKTDNYHVGDDLVDFYEQRAKGVLFSQRQKVVLTLAIRISM